MKVAAQLLGTDESDDEDLEALTDIGDRPAVLILAMVLAAFEWNTAQRTWRAGGRPYCKPYFRLLGQLRLPALTDRTSHGWPH